MAEISAGGIIVKGGRVVIVTQKNGSYSYPKGHVKREETLLDCAYREIREETGLRRKELTYVRELGIIERPDGVSGKGKVIHLFLFTTTKDDLKPLDPDNPEAVWMGMDDVASRLTYEADKEFFLKLKKSLERLDC